jgi:hypothetical protein
MNNGNLLGDGDWGLAQSPIPNPQSPIFIKLVIEHIIISYIVSIFNKFKKLIYFEF